MSRLSDKLPGQWLPEEVDPETGDGRPFRPDLPWFRNLRWVKLHAMQLGGGLAILIYWGQMLGFNGLAFGVAAFAAERIVSRHQKDSCRTNCDHSSGWHDVREKPWYFVSAGVFLWVVLVLIFGIPSSL